jgi:hypothetical protein
VRFATGVGPLSPIDWAGEIDGGARQPFASRILNDDVDASGEDLGRGILTETHEENGCSTPRGDLAGPACHVARSLDNKLLSAVLEVLADLRLCRIELERALERRSGAGTVAGAQPGHAARGVRRRIGGRQRDRTVEVP